MTKSPNQADMWLDDVITNLVYGVPADKIVKVFPDILNKEEIVEAKQAISAKFADLLDEAKTIIEDLVDEDDCWFDHHGYCQAHSWMANEPTCPHARAKEWLVARLPEGGEDE